MVCILSGERLLGILNPRRTPRLMPMNQASRTLTDRQLIARRRQAMAKALRRRLGFWRGIGRSNRLFPRKLEVTREG